MTESIAKKKQPGKTAEVTNVDRQVDALIALVGVRVRAARLSSGFSRRELSEVSGVSQRYLAQLEGGEGNISIGLLQRIAIAFDCSLESLLAEDDELSVEAAQVATMYKRADSQTRQRIQHVLNPDERREKKAHRLCLLGLRGAGKSTLGALIGDKLEIPFVELNDEIEQAAGIPIAEIIALYGQEGYRQLEATCLEKLIESEQRIVLAVAGGVVSDSDTFDRLLSRFNTVWIKASPDEHMDRVRDQGDLRPMADNPQAMVQLRQILKNREARYRLADFQLDTSARSLEQSLEELRELIVAEQLL